MLTSDDRWAINDLISQFDWAVDTGDADAWVSTFIEDGVFESVLVGRHEGHAAIRKLHAALWSRPDYRAWVGGQHRVTNVRVISQTETSAELHSNWIVVSVVDDDGKAAVTLTGDYNDHVVKEQGAWRFKSRKVLPAIPANEK
ncbi:MAG: hypothetical protein ABS81_06050 [Pseudonocardia sp. SCN 72-86]|nr:MAG: hypothetical protein ABS81_06050 [Pseudonocardia sp. SCN 72-86]